MTGTKVYLFQNACFEGLRIKALVHMVDRWQILMFLHALPIISLTAFMTKEPL